MRGNDAAAGSLFRCVDLEKRVRAGHPLRIVRKIVNATGLSRKWGDQAATANSVCARATGWNSFPCAEPSVPL
jgi:hypothetical protein